MDFNEIKKLMDEFNDSPTRELEITIEGFHIHLSKNENTFQPTVAPVVSAVPTASVPTTSEKSAPTPAVEKPSAQPEGTVIAAPMVGSIYLQPQPDKDPYVSVGSKVKKGDIVCIIEAMKMMTEIKSEFNGTISEILVDNEELVEFDQPLFRIVED